MRMLHLLKNNLLYQFARKFLRSVYRKSVILGGIANMGAQINLFIISASFTWTFKKVLRPMDQAYAVDFNANQRGR